MQTEPISHDDVHYNAADQCFEARITLHGAEGSRVYACRVPGDLSMPLEDAATALRADAIRRHTTEPGLFSAQEALKPAPLRAPTRAKWRTTLSLVLPALAGLRAA